MRLMKSILVAVTLCCIAAGALRSSTAHGPAAAPPFAANYQDIPPGFDFPADEAALLGFRDSGAVSAMRKHAWMVFAGMTQPTAGGEAIWETWFSEDETFAAGPAPQGIGPRRLQRRFHNPRQFATTNRGPAPQAVGASLLSFVLFNKDTFTHIRSNRLYEKATLDKINQSFDQNHTPVERREVAPFPRTAMSLKAVWWLVRQSGLTAMPIWDGKPTRPDVRGNPYPTWARFVAVDPSRTQIPPNEKTDVLFQGQTKKDSHVVPLAGFYSFQIGPNEVQAIRSVNGFETAQVGDYAALVGMHVTTKEIPDWIWATFWWHDRPNDGGFAQDRPGAVSGVWRNYLMDVAYSSDVPKESDNTPHVCFNPWLEARFSGGLTSNCMACHQRSVWTTTPFLPVTRGSLPADDQYFVGKTKLDFLWSVSLSSR
jgi:hypothetical protein